MLKKEELIKFTETKRLSLKNIEKDYLLELLLYLLSEEVGKDLIFKGGTALYKLYSLNRFSEDLDFTLASKKLKLEPLLYKIIRKLASIGISGKIKEIKKYQTGIAASLLIKGPLYDGSKPSLSYLSLDFSMRERPVYQPVIERIFPSYRDIPSFEVFVMPLEEMLAEKVRSIIMRDKARDVYDTWFLLKKGIKPDLNLINKKLKIHKQTFGYAFFISQLAAKEKTWKQDLQELLIGELPPFYKIKKEILDYFK